jgi:hypothetical protein
VAIAPVLDGVPEQGERLVRRAVAAAKATVAVRAVPATNRLPTSWAPWRASSSAAAAAAGLRSASASASANRAMAMAVGLAEARAAVTAWPAVGGIHALIWEGGKLLLRTEGECDLNPEHLLEVCAI